MVETKRGMYNTLYLIMCCRSNELLKIKVTQVVPDIRK